MVVGKHRENAGGGIRKKPQASSRNQTDRQLGRYVDRNTSYLAGAISNYKFLFVRVTFFLQLFSHNLPRNSGGKRRHQNGRTIFLFSGAIDVHLDHAHPTNFFIFSFVLEANYLDIGR